jgi:hypothetical protein
MAGGRPLAELPTLVSAVGEGVVRASDHLAWSSLQQVASTPSLDRSGPAVRSLRLAMRVQLSIGQSRRIFFWFGRHEAQPQITMDAEISAQLIPAALTGSTRVRVSRAVQCLTLLPEFILPPAAVAEYRRLTRLMTKAPGSPANATNTLLLELPKGVLAIYNPRRNGVFEHGRAQLQYTPSSGSPVLIHDPRQSNLLLNVFLDLLEVLRRWSRNDVARTGAPLRHDAMDSEQDFFETLNALVQAYRDLRAVGERFHVESRLRDVLARAADADPSAATAGGFASSVGAWSQHFSKFDASGFAAELTLRVDQRGNFAHLNEDDPFDLAVKMRVEDDAADSTRVTLEIGIPDFLVAPERTLRFHAAALRTPKVVRRIAKELAIDKHEAIAFLEANADSVTVFRLRRRVRIRRRIDDDMMLWRGSLRGHETVVLAWVRLKISTDGAIRIAKFNVEYAGSPAAPARLGAEVDEYIQKVTTVLQRWVSLGLPRA